MNAFKRWWQCLIYGHWWTRNDVVSAKCICCGKIRRTPKQRGDVTLDILLAIILLVVASLGSIHVFEEGRRVGQYEGLRIPCATHSPKKIDLLGSDCIECSRTCQARARMDKIKPLSK